MSLVLNPEQRQFQESARRFFSQRAPVSSFRALRDSRDPQGYSPVVWKQMVELGFAAAPIGESYGGLGLGLVTMGSILGESGRTLCASPLFATGVLGASAIELAGSEQQREEALSAVTSGGLTLAFALDEGHRHDPRTIRASATRSASRYVLNGEKKFVIDGQTADKLIVVTSLDDGTASGTDLAFFMVDRGSPGVSVAPMSMVDSRNAAHVSFDNVSVGQSARLQGTTDSRAALNSILDRGRACLAAEMVGGIDTLFEQTMSYLREREQFGVKIGSFQALKHRAARMYAEIELTRSAVIAALSALDRHAADSAQLAALAKARANDTYRLVSNEATQMHGGMGVTDELDIGLFLKRSRTSTQYFGDSSYLRNRYAELSGY